MKRRQGGDREKVLAHLVAFRGEHHAVLIFYRQTQLKGVNRVQTESVAKQRRLAIDILNGKLIQILMC